MVQLGANGGGVALAGGIAAAILTLVMAVLPKKAYACGQAVLLALSLATFLQGNGLNASYGELNGKAIDWSAYIMRSAQLARASNFTYS